MSEWIIYHNPRCSKSRETLGLLEKQKIQNLQVVEYLKRPPQLEELRTLIKKLGLRPKDVVRTKEEEFKRLNLNLESDESVLLALVKHPVLLERPIVVHGSRAIIGRPPEKVKDLF